uniref:dihydroorotase n=1 Tax=Tetradesmus obliquus TaxID=3088 RepID=A0A383W571_TETOB
MLLQPSATRLRLAGGLQGGEAAAWLRPATASRRHVSAAAGSQQQTLTITTPDDWHLHVRDGDNMRSVVPHTAAHFARAIIMPNLVPPVTNTQLALDYRARIAAATPKGAAFTPLMTLYLTDNTSADDVAAAAAAGIVAYKLYPAGATTNSDSGVTDMQRCLPALRAMAQAGLLLLVHGEVTDADVDMFDREAVFIETKLKPLLDQVPELKVVMEHITTADAAAFVAGAPANVAATITPQHMLLNRNALFAKGLRPHNYCLPILKPMLSCALCGCSTPLPALPFTAELQKGLRPHNYCLPILKRERHREAVAAAATSGSAKFFLGTDSAPHAVGTKEAPCGCAGIFSAPIALSLYAMAFEQAGALDRLEAFASHNGPDFYGLPRNSGSITLVKKDFAVPPSYSFGASTVVPMWAGETLSWQVQQ